MSRSTCNYGWFNGTHILTTKMHKKLMAKKCTHDETEEKKIEIRLAHINNMWYGLVLTRKGNHRETNQSAHVFENEEKKKYAHTKCSTKSSVQQTLKKIQPQSIYGYYLGYFSFIILRGEILAMLIFFLHLISKFPIKGKRIHFPNSSLMWSRLKKPNESNRRRCDKSERNERKSNSILFVAPISKWIRSNA